MKTAILVVSFGTSFPDAFEENIRPMEKAIAAAYPDALFHRAYGSGMIIRRLKRRDHITVDTVQEALDRLQSQGVTDVVVQPTFLIHGVEYDLLMAVLRKNLSGYQSVRVGEPLLNALEDYEAVGKGLRQAYPLNGGEALVLMGHGTPHFANAAYPALEHLLHARGCENVLIGAVEGYPPLAQVVEALKRRDVTRVILVPFMLVAGDHAKNDMASEEEGSWKSILEKAGYSVSCDVRGLGGQEYIQALFADHAANARLLQP